MKYLLACAVAAGMWTQSAWSGTMEKGPVLEASDLVQQLQVFATTFTYKQETPFSKISYHLSYKERSADGTYKEKTYLSSTGIETREPVKEMEFKVLAGADRSTVIWSNGASSGKGEPDLVKVPSSTGFPPQLREGGGYVLLTILREGTTSDLPESIKGILEFELTVGK